MWTLKGWPILLSGHVFAANLYEGPNPTWNSFSYLPGRRIIGGENRGSSRRLHAEQPRLGRRIGVEAVIPVEMIGRDVEQHCDVAIEALGQVDLVARQLEHIDADP